MRIIEFQQRVARTRVDACKLLEFSALDQKSPGSSPARAGVGSRSASVDARQDLSSASSAAAAWPRSTSTPTHHGRAAPTNQRVRPATSQVGTTFLSRPNFLFLKRGTPTRIFQRHKLAPS